MTDRSYYREFEASVIGRLKARWAYVKLDERYKLMAEINGVVMVGANYKAREIAIKVFNAYLGKISERERQALLEKIYKGKERKIPEVVAETRGKNNLLEMLCQDAIFDMVKNNTIKQTLVKLMSPSQSASSGH